MLHVVVVYVRDSGGGNGLIPWLYASQWLTSRSFSIVNKYWNLPMVNPDKQWEPVVRLLLTVVARAHSGSVSRREVHR